jgi:hypothetical protein
MVVIPQIWGRYDRDNVWHDGVEYTWTGAIGTDRAALINATVDDLGHDDFNIATVDDGRLVAFGHGMDDFGPDDDGVPHGGHDLVEISRACGLDPPW